MANAKGNPNTKGNPHGAGRKKGIPNKWTLLTDEARKQLAEANDGITPLQFFLSLLRDPKTPIEYKIRAAKEAAPYMHRKMPISIEGGDPRKPIVMLQKEHMKMLDDAELSTLYAILAKLNEDK